MKMDSVRQRGTAAPATPTQSGEKVTVSKRAGERGECILTFPNYTVILKNYRTKLVSEDHKDSELI